MITDLNVIVKEWAYRVHDGKPNPNNSAHLYQLSELLIENKWPLSVIDELLQNLKEVDIVQKKQADGSYGSSYTVKKHNPDRGQKLIKKDASKDDIKNVEKGKEPSDDKDKKQKPEKEESEGKKLNDVNDEHYKKGVDPTDEDYQKQKEKIKNKNKKRRY